MAVYKPTNCQPYLTTLDLLECTSGNDNYSGIPTVFECKVDTSNTKVTAYAITLYNSDNTQIFPVDAAGNPVEPQDNITFISDLAAVTGMDVSGNILVSNTGYNLLNSGINGSYLRIPVFVDSGTSISNSSTLSFNTLFVSSSGTVQAKSRGQTELTPVTIENGQQYKWVITLFQGVQKGSGTPPDAIFPTSIYEYDMIVTTGQVMGSNIERIQSYLSDEIYVDYYVQPLLLTYNNSDGTTTPVTIHVLDETEGTWEARNSSGARLDWEDVNTELVGDRVLIKNYDSSYGYIYPTTGDYGFPEGLISKGQANAFQIYSMSNNAEDLTTVRMVSVVPYTTIPWSWVNMEGSQGSSYAQQVYYVLDTQNSIPDIFYPFETELNWGLLHSLEQDASQNCFVQSGTGNIGISAQTRIVLNYQAQENTTASGDTAVNWYADYIDHSGPSGGRMEDGPLGVPSECVDNPSPFNGIYTPSFSVDSRTQIGGQYYRRVTVNWRRASDADAWGELSTKIVKVTSTYPDQIAKFGGENIQTQKYTTEESGGGEISYVPIDDSTVAGTLNQTPLKFSNEKPLTIYSHTLSSTDMGVSLINNTGIILYNDDPDISASASNRWPDDGTLATLYIRPYVGIGPEMWIRELGVSENASRFFLVKEVNTTTWAVKYNPYEVYVGKTISNDNVSDNAVFDIGQRYQIRTFYKSSDENPFNLYSNPNITLTFYPSDWQGEGDTETRPYEEDEQTEVVTIGSRSFTVSCDYTQDQYIWWKSFNYTLYDMVGNELSTSGDKYDGLMQHTFYGLINENSYVLVLTVETYSGNVISIQRELYCDFEATDLTNTFPFDVYFDCDINAVRAEFRVTGYILPNVVDENGNQVSRVVAETSNNTSPAISGVTYNSSGSMNIGQVDEEGVTYTHAVGSLETAGGLSQLTAESDSVLVQSSHTVNSSRFAGNFICAYVGFDSSEAKLPDDYKLVVYIPDELVVDEEGYTTENPDRNKVMYDLLDSNGASVISGPLVANLYNQTGNQISGNKWRDDLYVLPEWQSVIKPDKVSQIDFGDSNHVVYKPVDDILSDVDNNYHIENARNISGYFNTTSSAIVYSQGNPSRANEDWYYQEGAPKTQKSVLLSVTDGLFAQGDQSAGDTLSENIVYTGFTTSDGNIFCATKNSGNQDDTEENRNAFVLVNKMPVIWGDYNFTIMGESNNTDTSTQWWKIAAIMGTEKSDGSISLTNGVYTRTYWENTDSPLIWNDMEDSEEQGTATGAAVRWFDGWGYNNGTGLEDGKKYDADLSPVIYVGNQTKVTDASLTNSERASINRKTFAIQAKIGVNDEGQTYIEPDVRVYLSGINN